MPFTGSVKDIVVLNKRRIALPELTIRLQVTTSSPWPAPLRMIDQMLEER
jgi:hypothetical protein